MVLSQCNEPGSIYCYITLCKQTIIFMITDANLGVVNIGQLALSRLAIFEVSFNYWFIHQLVVIGGLCGSCIILLTGHLTLSTLLQSHHWRGNYCSGDHYNCPEWETRWFDWLGLQLGLKGLSLFWLLHTIPLLPLQ